jgi:protein-tyrosine phosphatase
MKIGSVLVVCVGNICRSPVGERALARLLPDVRVSSAGLSAMRDSPADAAASQAAAELGLDLDGHRGRQWTGAIGAMHDLILVMEPDHRNTIVRAHPELSGKTFLMTQWTGAKPVTDPYGRSNELHRLVAKQIIEAAEAWAAKLKGRS